MKNMNFLAVAPRAIATALALCCFYSFTGMYLAEPVVAKSNKEDRAPDRLIVKFREGVNEQTKQAFLQRLGIRSMRQLELIEADLLKVPDNRSLASWHSIIRNSQLVSYVAYDDLLTIDALRKKRSAKKKPAKKKPKPKKKKKKAPRRKSSSSKAKTSRSTTTNYKVPNDPYLSRLWGFNNTGQTGGTKNVDINALEAWKRYSPKYTIVVGVIDTGVDRTHPDLADNMWLNSGEDIDRNGIITRKDMNGRDDDGNGYIDDFYGWNWVNNNNRSTDDHGHGTHVSGTIAARGNNAYGVVGVEGSGRVRIMPLKFLDKYGRGYTSDAIDALNYARKKKALITNNSWGGGYYNYALFQAIRAYEKSGGLFIAAAGNNASSNDSYPMYPASYRVDNVISVASITHTGQLSGFSNYGVSSVHLAAPGSNIFSTVPGRRFAYYSGTSMATPHVCGAAALLWSHAPHLSARDVKDILLSTVTQSKALERSVQSGGYLNLEAALKYVDDPEGEDNS